MKASAEHISASPDERQIFRDRLCRLLLEARAFDGTRSGYEELMEAAIAHEAGLQQSFDLPPGKKVPAEIEKEALAAWHPGHKNDREISQLLELAATQYGDRVSTILRHLSVPPAPGLGAEIDPSQYNITVLHGVILRPQEMNSSPRRGQQPKKRAEKKEHMKISKLLAALSQEGVMMDDIRLVVGQLEKGMRRRDSYVGIEIPSLNREALVCDSPHEMSFVIRGIVEHGLLKSLQKDELRATFRHHLREVRTIDEDIAVMEILNHLMRGTFMESSADRDERQRNLLDKKLRDRLKTPKEWVDLSAKQRSCFLQETGLSLDRASTLHGIPGEPSKQKGPFLELARRIMGNHPDFEYKRGSRRGEAKPIIEALRKSMTPEEWAAMDLEKRHGLEVLGLKMLGIARSLGFEGDPINNTADRMALGRMIFGNHPALHHEVSQEWQPADYASAILNKAPTLEVWMATGSPAREKLKLKFNQKGLNAIARILGIEGNPTTNNGVYEQLWHAAQSHQKTDSEPPHRASGAYPTQNLGDTEALALVRDAS